MLKLRIVTAVVLVAILVACLAAASPIPALALFVLVAMLATWEWLRLVWPKTYHSLAVIIAAGVGIVLSFAAIGLADSSHASLAWRPSLDMATVAVALVWIALVPAMLVRAHTHERRHPVGLGLFGVAASMALWYSLAALLLRSGAWYLVSMMALIWVADSAAYFVGRAWGRRRLAPAVSPGKTWEGAWGGLLGAVLWVILNTFWPGSFGDQLVARWGWAVALLTAALLAGVSIVGDLFESLLKRRAGMKDSSRLLPGHGGVLDRIDALYPVAPIVLLISGGP